MGDSKPTSGLEQLNADAMRANLVAANDPNRVPEWAFFTYDPALGLVALDKSGNLWVGAVHTKRGQSVTWRPLAQRVSLEPDVPKPEPEPPAQPQRPQQVGDD